jgi:hypothetical protein
MLPRFNDLHALLDRRPQRDFRRGEGESNQEPVAVKGGGQPDFGCRGRVVSKLHPRSASCGLPEQVSYPGLKRLGLSLALPAPLASETYGLLTQALWGEPQSEYMPKGHDLEPFTQSRFPDWNRQDSVLNVHNNRLRPRASFVPCTRTSVSSIVVFSNRKRHMPVG